MCLEVSLSATAVTVQYSESETGDIIHLGMDPDFPLYIRFLSRGVQAFTVLCHYAALGDVYLLCCVVIHMEVGLLMLLAWRRLCFCLCILFL